MYTEFRTPQSRSTQVCDNRATELQSNTSEVKLIVFTSLVCFCHVSTSHTRIHDLSFKPQTEKDGVVDQHSHFSFLL